MHPFAHRSASARPLVAIVGLAAIAILSVAPAALHAADQPAPPSSSDPRVEIVSSASSWDNLSELFLGNTPGQAFSEGSMFVMRGELRNKGSRPIHHVVLRYELLDASGNVLQDMEGYNRGAESMRPDEEGVVRPEKVVPLAPGASDSFRMVFFHDEVPQFAGQRVRVVEVHENAPAAATEKPDAAGAARGAAPEKPQTSAPSGAARE